MVVAGGGVGKSWRGRYLQPMSHKVLCTAVHNDTYLCTTRLLTCIYVEYLLTSIYTHQWTML